VQTEVIVKHYRDFVFVLVHWPYRFRFWFQSFRAFGERIEFIVKIISIRLPIFHVFIDCLSTKRIGLRCRIPGIFGSCLQQFGDASSDNPFADIGSSFDPGFDLFQLFSQSTGFRFLYFLPSRESGVHGSVQLFLLVQCVSRRVPEWKPLS